jgi:nitrate reductase gamma subunit
VGGVVFILMLIFGWLPLLFGIIIPYIAIITFISGFIYKVVKWGKSPVPFRIPTTCGQAKSLPWIKENNLEAPHNLRGVIGRMFLEIFLFRSLFRNTKAELKGDSRLVYGSSKWLWVAAMAFHACFLVIFLRHLRFFAEPVPSFALWLQDLDGMFQIGVPALFLSNIVILAALGYLLWRRIYDAKIKYISLPADYFALLLIIGIVITGMLTRHIFKVDIVEAKKLAIGLFTLSPSMPGEIGFWFYVHLFLLSVFFAYFPFSKLMHLPGIFMSPTRNLINSSRIKRHINPWNYPVKVHTYEEYEDEFRDKMKAAGLPLDKE